MRPIAITHIQHLSQEVFKNSCKLEREKRLNSFPRTGIWLPRMYLKIRYNLLSKYAKVSPFILCPNQQGRKLTIPYSSNSKLSKTKRKSLLTNLRKQLKNVNCNSSVQSKFMFSFQREFENVV